LEKVVALYKDRVSTLNELADAVEPFYVEVYPGAELLAQHVTDAARDALRELRTRLETTVWERAQLNQALKDVVAARGLKLPQLAIPAARGADRPAADAVHRCRAGGLRPRHRQQHNAYQILRPVEDQRRHHQGCHRLAIVQRVGGDHHAGRQRVAQRATGAGRGAQPYSASQDEGTADDRHDARQAERRRTFVQQGDRHAQRQQRPGGARKGIDQREFAAAIAAVEQQVIAGVQ
jgi:hypothetical protein